MPVQLLLALAYWIVLNFIRISTTSSFSLGSATNAWKDIWVSNGTINFVDSTGTLQATLSSTAEGLAVSGALIVTEIVAPSGSVSSFTGSLEGTASFALTASYALNAGVTIDTGSLVTTSSFNSFTSSYNTGSFTGSFTGSLFGTASIAISASWAPFTPTDTGSLLVTASVSNNTITFTKGDASTFDITVNTGSVDLSGYTTNNTFNAFTSSYNTGSFTGSLQGVAATASYYVETDPIFTAVSGTLATTGSNAFVGNQTISGSLNVTGSIMGSLLGTASYAFLAETASYALTAETASYAITVTSSILYVTSSSYSETASYVENAQSASYVLNAVSASFASTASFVNVLNQNLIVSGSIITHQNNRSYNLTRRAYKLGFNNISDYVINGGAGTQNLGAGTLGMSLAQDISSLLCTYVGGFYGFGVKVITYEQYGGVANQLGLRVIYSSAGGSTSSDAMTSATYINQVGTNFGLQHATIGFTIPDTYLSQPVDFVKFEVIMSRSTGGSTSVYGAELIFSI